MRKKPLVIFEMANNHMGDISHGKKIINKFSKISKKYNSKIEFAFKFQFRNLDSYIHSSFKRSDHNHVKRFLDTKLTENEWEILLKYCRNKGFKIICTAFDERSVDKIINNNFDYLKIASCSMDEWPLLEYIARKSKKNKIICSLGGANKSSIRNVISFFLNKKINVSYLYCVAKYPTSPKNLNLEYFKYLKNIYPQQVNGYSTHEDPSETLTAALVYAMGGRIFEKHVGLLSKKYELNKYSSDPNQTDVWLRELNSAIERCGSVENREKYLNQEVKNLNVFKRGVFLKKNILFKKKNEILNIHDVELAFPAVPGQLLSNNFSKFRIIKLKKKILSGEKIFKKDIKIYDNRKFIEIVRDKVLYLINRNYIIVNKLSKLEISHHYGIKNFYKFGLSMITIHNSDYCKKLLFLFYKQKHPDQYHKKKKETFFIIFGKIKLKINKSTKTIILKSGDTYTIYPNQIHNFESISKDGSIIEELSTESIKEDSFYIDKKITNNKNRKSFISLY